jgi:ceramide glucosyltransferase
MLQVLLIVGLFGLLTSTVFAGMVLAGTRHHLRASRLSQPAPGFAPSLSLLKPLHGAEHGLEANLVSFFEQEYPASQYEILFCAADPGDPGLAIARQVAVRYPQIRASFFSTGNPKYINAKVHSLEVMAAHAANQIYVISDSDVRVTPGYLRAVAQDFADAEIGASTCLYRGVAAEGGLWARLEAVGMSVEMTAGVLVANMLEGMQFVLGPTMAFRRECIEEMGGFAVTGDYCSDDYILGNQAWQHGWRVALSHHAIDHIILHTGFVASLNHQVRWMKSTRFSRPKGHFGTSLTFSMPFGLLAAAATIGLDRPILAASCLGWAIVTRWLIAWATGCLVVRDPARFDLFSLYPLRDLMGFGFWVASYLSSNVLWRGQVYQLLPGGKMRAAT